MELNLESLSTLFDERLLPLRSDIKELKDGQKQVVELLLTQARQDEKLKRVDEHLQECVVWRKETEIKINEKFGEIAENKIEEDKKKELVLWDIIKILLYILAGSSVGATLSKFIFK